MDVHNKHQRSKNMAAIKSSGTKPELALGKALWHIGLRYLKNDKSVFGKPDFTFKKYKIAVFVDSEFFHGKDWETKKRPLNNAEFWYNKISRNIERDKQVNQHLEQEGWIVLRFWSNDIKKNIDECVSIVKSLINEKKAPSF